MRHNSYMPSVIVNYPACIANLWHFDNTLSNLPLSMSKSFSLSTRLFIPCIRQCLCIHVVAIYRRSSSNYNTNSGSCLASSKSTLVVIGVLKVNIAEMLCTIDLILSVLSRVILSSTSPLLSYRLTNRSI